MAYWAAGGTIIAVLLSVACLYLPLELGGYFDWNHPHSAFHNAVAILSRLVVFALIGAARAGSWHHYRRRHRR